MGQPIRVMHFADTHFGVELYGRLDTESGLNTRLKDFKRSLLKAIDMALAAGIDLAVFAGDAYKTRDPRQTDQREFADCIRRLTDAGIPVVLLVGNHDMPAIRGRANAVEIYRTLGVTNVFVLSRPDTILIPTSRGPVRVVGMPYLIKGYSVAREDFLGKTLDETRQMLEDKYAEYLRGLADEVVRAADDVPTILLGHFWANGARLSSWQQSYFNLGEPQVPLSELTNPAFDYVALGHIHKHQDLNKSGHPHVVYSGSPDRIDFGEKDEVKGWVWVQLRKGGADYEFMRVDEGRNLLDIVIEADCDEPTEKILEEVKRYALRNSIVKLTYKIGHARVGLVRERDIREALSAAFLVVSINRRVERDVTTRNRMLTESKTPREALELFIDTRENYRPHKARLLEYAEPLFKELSEEETGW